MTHKHRVAYLLAHYKGNGKDVFTVNKKVVSNHEYSRIHNLATRIDCLYTREVKAGRWKQSAIMYI